MMAMPNTITPAVSSCQKTKETRYHGDRDYASTVYSAVVDVVFVSFSHLKNVMSDDDVWVSVPVQGFVQHRFH